MRQKSFPQMKWRLALALGVALSIFLLLVPVNRSTAQVQQQNGQSRQLQQTEVVGSWPSKAKRWALVIGVDQYRDGNISPLRGAANDAGKLARALTDYAGFPADQVILLATDQPEERQPTRINILTYLSNLSSAVPKDGLLLVAFAGHGIERGGQAYLIPSDARLTDDVSLLEESAISVARMHQRIRAASVAQVMVLLDACRNDPGGRADAPNPLTQSYVRGFNFDVRNREVQAFATIYATAVGQRAYEYQEKKQGYFTWAIIEGLKGGAANDKGEVTLAALVKYVQDVVPKRIAIDLGLGRKQQPFAVIEGYKAEELVVGVTPANLGSAAQNSRPQPLPDTANPIVENPAGRARIGDTVPLVRVMNATFAGDYSDKPIRVLARFSAPGQMENYIFGAIPKKIMEGKVAFRVSSPDQIGDAEVPFGTVPPHVFINKAQGGLVFELKKGDLILLTGSTVVGRIANPTGQDFIQVIFLASSIEKVE